MLGTRESSEEFFVNCQQCGKRYNDVYCSTMCPHNEFEMHTGVTINGTHGCAHSIEQLSSNDAPNTDCPILMFRQKFGESLMAQTRRL